MPRNQLSVIGFRFFEINGLGHILYIIIKQLPGTVLVEHKLSSHTSVANTLVFNESVSSY